MSLHPKPDLTHGPIQDCSEGKDEFGFGMIPDHPLAMTTTDTLLRESIRSRIKELRGYLDKLERTSQDDDVIPWLQIENMARTTDTIIYEAGRLNGLVVDH